MKLEGKVAVVTGASKGIGRSIAVRFASEGAKLVVSARGEAALNDLKHELEKFPAETEVVVADMKNEGDVVRLIRRASERFGRIDVLVNNAGIGLFKPVAETKTEEFDSVVSVNLRGVFIATREVIPHMVRQNDGVIINISSLAGKNAIENGAVYAATKWALLGFGKSVMLEVRKHNIRVVTICPGSVDTEFHFGGRVANKALQPDDIADAALLAASLPPRAMMSEIDLRPTNPK